MKMKVKWHTRARSRWMNACDYILQKFGIHSQERFILSTAEWIGILKQMPQIGIIEPLLIHRVKGYRSVTINKLSKLIFFVKEDTIYIADFWDTRREPRMLSKELK